ncbi:transketolase [Tindallia californiensis]|uniref:Transketolase n=1 Tax=Tindallia californiensis TaxID=159292 RepID=A0A1H3L573_9FIRM|nr:transketolase [Tindallia californiensis]SDY59563.1 transketolase [Tindallia californiensis]
MEKNMDQLAVNAIRVLSAEAVEKAKSGHPGLPMGAAPMAYTLWSRVMNHNPKNPAWRNRDRFILSAGHGSMLLYSLLHLFGYNLNMEEIKQFRQWDSQTPGHPEYGHTVGVETTTGPLGQGIANGVGMAMAESKLAAQFNKETYSVIDHYTYVLAGDGCLMEGISAEASSLAGTLGLGKLVVLYDSNDISIEGSTSLAFREDVKKRYEAYGWQVLQVKDGNDIEAIQEALEKAKSEKERPSLIEVVTEIGYGSPAKQGKASAHGEPLGAENLLEAKKFLSWQEEPFILPKEVDQVREATEVEGMKKEAAWEMMLEEYFEKFPEKEKEWEMWFGNTGIKEALEDKSLWNFEKADATRSASGEMINRLAGVLPNLVGGSADLAPSNKTLMKDREDYLPNQFHGSNLRFGVREHAMAAIGNGIALHGGLVPYVATFFVFTDYMKAAMRLSSLMKQPLTYVLTHDSIGVGEDGPTHQPIEHLMALRSLPNMIVFRPADGKETAMGWKLALMERETPVSLVLTRQKLPLYEKTGEEALKGAYILEDAENGKPDILLMATGSEVELVMGAAEILKTKGYQPRVISMPSWELFESQSQEYKDRVMPPEIRKRVAVEAGSTLGWYKYVGLDGKVIGLDHFGASAPAGVLFEKFGLTVDNVVEASLSLF